jgi:hypothetical protein
MRTRVIQDDPEPAEAVPAPEAEQDAADAGDAGEARVPEPDANGAKP